MSSRKTILSRITVATFALALVIVQAPAQIPDTFSNLQILHKEITKAELVGVMRGFASSLGVRCNFCHVGTNVETLEGFDFASDEKKRKQVARLMMRMVSEINSNHISKVDESSPMRVRCITCHRGIKNPQSLRDLLLESVEKKSVEAAASLYRSLREDHYGDGAYDFSAGTLNSVSEALARQKQDLDGALTMIRLNLEFHLESHYSFFIESQLLVGKGDRTGAVASLEKAIALDPSNNWYKAQLERLKN